MSQLMSRLRSGGWAGSVIVAWAVMLVRAGRVAAAPPGTRPTTVATPAWEAAEVGRLFDVGLPSRDFLMKAWADHAARWRSADAAGDADAAFLLGTCLRDGIGQPADPVAASTQLGVAAARGSAAARVRLGIMTMAGQVVRRDAAAAADDLRRGADAGDTSGMICLSLCYEVGRGVTQDPAAALQWAQRAVEAGSLEGLVRLSTVYQYGVGLPADPSMSVQCLRRAADTGSFDAMGRLGDLCLAAGRAPEAAAWLKRAADAGDPAAMLRLGGLYDSDRLGPRDEKAAMAWVTKAADTGDPAATLVMGNVCARGAPPAVLPRPTLAFKWYRQSVNNGGYAGLVKLGDCYLRGYGTRRDLSAARLCFRRGADAGDRACMAEMAVTYFPDVVPTGADAAQAFRWSKRAADLGDPDGMNRLAVCFLKGIGEPADPAEALRWFRRAADAGQAEAMNSVGLRYDRGEGVARDRAEALRWFDDAARHGNGHGMLNMGDAFAHGTGVTADGARAEHLWQEAVSRFLADGDAREAGGAQVRLCMLYLDPKSGVADAGKATKSAEFAAADGACQAWACMAAAAGSGTVLRKDPVACNVFYRAGADARDPAAMCGLGSCFEHGIGCPVDGEAAGAWYRRAADAGWTDAMVSLGLLYWKRETSDADYRTAADWLRKAAERGNALGAGDLSILLCRGQGMPPDMDEALVMARKAEAAGRPEFVAAVADVYLQGRGAVPKDVDRGTALLREAADHGHGPSKARVQQLGGGSTAGGAVRTTRPVGPGQ